MANEARESSASESDDGEEGPNMMNFMFGNVDSEGNLEGDFLDEVCCSFPASHLYELPWPGPAFHSHVDLSSRRQNSS